MHLPHLRRVLVILCVLVLYLVLIREAAAQPDPVALIRFTATPSVGQIIIEWETAFEQNIVGFCVQRSLHGTGNFSRIPDCVLPKGDGVTGASYNLADSDVVTETVYDYRLEVINSGGAIDYYGPVSVALSSCSNVTEISQPECEALVTLYERTNGPGWTRREGWLETLSPCSWYGVACEAGHVRSLSLPHNALNGTVPPELSHLTELQSLNFGSCDIIIDEGGHKLVEHGPLNRLDGAIPRELGALHNLRSLNLNCARLQGTIPPELGDLANLQALDLDGNLLIGVIPPELGKLTGLHWLDISWNQLTGTPPATLGNLTNLQSLGFSNNPLSGPLHRSLMNLKLERLFFDATKLCEPPDAAFQDWLAGIPYLGRTGTICQHSIYLPLIHRGPAPTAPPFWADSYQITQGQCTFLHWSVTNVQAVYLDGMPVAGQGSHPVCPSNTTTYVLWVIDMSGQVVERELTITVVPDAPEVIFVADKTRLAPGECTTLRWSVTNVQAVYLNGQGVPGQSVQQVCPEATTIYVLRVLDTSGQMWEYPLVIVVESDAPWIGVDAAGNFYRGNSSAAVKLEEFMDFQCPFCARHALQTGPLIQTTYIDTGQALHVFRNFPLDIHANARPAARAAYCAGQQSPALFWAMYDWLFANQASWRQAPDAADRFMKAAVAVGADQAQYDLCVVSPATEAHIQHDMDAGGARGVRGTPDFFINRCRIIGALPFATFQNTIEAAMRGSCPPAYPTPAPPSPTPISTVAPEPTKAPPATPVPVVDRPMLTNRP